MSASWGEYEWVSKGELVKVSRGELVTSYRKLANACGVSLGCVRRAMKSLEVGKTIAVSAAHGRTRIYVMNYAKYNDVDCATGTQTGSVTGSVTGSPTGSHKEEDKEDKENLLSEIPLEAIELAAVLVLAVASRYPGSAAARDREKHVAKWAPDIDKINRLDERPWSKIREVIDWSQRDDFWQKNIRSGKKLREQFDTLEAKMAGGRKSRPTPQPPRENTEPPTDPLFSLTAEGAKAQ